MSQASERKIQREQYITDLLGGVGLTLSDLPEGTVEALHEYARFMLTSGDAPSASWNTPVNELCRAVESLIAIRLGCVTGLERLAEDTTLGEKASFLMNTCLHFDTGLLCSSGLDSDYVCGKLPKKLKKLAGIRSESKATHGSAVPRHATPKHAQSALKVAITGKEAIIPALARGRPRS